MITFKDNELHETYEEYMDELEEIKELLSEVGTPYAILNWWYATEYHLTWDTYYRYRTDGIKLIAVLENEVEMVLHKHFTDDVIAEYRKMFSQYGLMQMGEVISNVISKVADKCEGIDNSIYRVSEHLDDIYKRINQYLNGY